LKVFCTKKIKFAEIRRLKPLQKYLFSASLEKSGNLLSGIENKLNLQNKSLFPFFKPKQNQVFQNFNRIMLEKFANRVACAINSIRYFFIKTRKTSIHNKNEISKDLVV
jgi:hypothetical protein